MYGEGWFLYWSGSVLDGVPATSEENWKTHLALSWLASGTAQSIARARNRGQGCNTLLHLCSGVYVAWPWMAYCGRSSERDVIRGRDLDSRCEHQSGPSGPSPKKPRLGHMTLGEFPMNHLDFGLLQVNFPSPSRSWLYHHQFLRWHPMTFELEDGIPEMACTNGGRELHRAHPDGRSKKNRHWATIHDVFTSILFKKIHGNCIFPAHHATWWVVSLPAVPSMGWKWFDLPKATECCWLVVWNMNFITDELTFFRGVQTTNQIIINHH